MTGWFECVEKYAGDNEFYRYGDEAQERVEKCLTEHDGYISIPVDGGTCYAIGTSKSAYGEFAKIGGVCFSVNKGGYAYAKAGTDKCAALVASIKGLLVAMKRMCGEKPEADAHEKDWRRHPAVWVWNERRANARFRRHSA